MKTTTQKVLGILALCGCLGFLIIIAAQIMIEKHRSAQAAAFALTPVQEVRATAAVNRQGVNLNTASFEELMSLPGIGEHLARQIIQHREQQAFHFLEDLRVINGFGDRRIDSLRGLAYVELSGTD